MLLDASKYQSNIVIIDAETLVKNRALEDASIPENLGFIIKPSSVSTSPAAENNEGNNTVANNVE